jgi:hypothetical protein
MIGNSPKKWLVVIVERHILWNLWCIDFLNKSVCTANQLVVLDLSKLRPKSRKKNSRFFLTKFYRKNRIENIVKRAYKNLQVEVIVPEYYLPRKGQSTDLPHRSNANSFLNGLDSQYFEELGERVVSESQLPQDLLRSSKNLFDSAFRLTTKAILEKNIIKVIVPGGRTLIPNAVMSAALNLNIECTVLEQVTSKSSSYLEFPSNFRQEMKFHQDEIDRLWLEGGPDKVEISKGYLQRKLFGGQMGRNFSLQFDSEIELVVPPEKKLVTIFVGSGFEMTPTSEKGKRSQLGSQHQKEIFQLFCQIAGEFGFFVVLRGHPSTPGLEEMYAAEDLEWSRFCDDVGVMHLPSTSRLDSYKLMKQSSLNVVYASTVGIDSILLGANTLVLANTDWAHLVPDICAFDEESIRNRFHDFEKIVPVERVYPYAYYMECGGVKLPGVEIHPDGRIHLAGKEIGEPRFHYLQRIFHR